LVQTSCRDLGGRYALLVCKQLVLANIIGN
jgi:hypothetical protein